MKRILNYTYLKSLLFLLVAFACTDEFNSPSSDDIPLAADVDIEILVDQTTNEVTFKLNEPGMYPVWIFEEATKTTYSTVNGLQKKYTLAGTYTVKVRVGNSNGISDGSVTKTFTIDDSLLNPEPGGYNSDNACNFWKSVTYTNSFYYAPGWVQRDDPGFEANGNMYKITLPAATTDQWQAQVMFVGTNLSSVATKNYDFSAVFFSNKDHNNVTVKLVKDGENSTFFFEQKIALQANEDFVFIKTNMPGIDMSTVNLVLDFGGNAEGTEVIVRRVVFKEHSCDDGSGIEEPEPEDDTVNWLPDSECNDWKDVAYTSFFYHSGDGGNDDWADNPNPITMVAGDNNYKVTIPDVSSQQWQAQVHFMTTNLSTTTGKEYDFRVILKSTKNITGATIKLGKVKVVDADDGIFFFTERVNLVAGQEKTFKMSGMAGVDIDHINLIFDFGGAPASSEVTISSVILKESTCNN